MSKASVDFPEPETPVTTVNRLRGIATLMFFKLCSRALWISIAPSPRMREEGGSRSERVRGVPSAASYSRSARPVCELGCPATSAGVPAHTIVPPASPPSGPRSTIQSAARTPAAGGGGRGLPEPQVLEPDAGERLERPLHLGVAEKNDRLGHGQLEGVGDRFLPDFHFEDLIAKAPAVAVGTAQVHVGEELHLHVLEAVAAAARPAPVPRIEAKRARSGFAPPSASGLLIALRCLVPSPPIARH